MWLIVLWPIQVWFRSLDKFFNFVKHIPSGLITCMINISEIDAEYMPIIIKQS